MFFSRPSQEEWKALNDLVDAQTARIQAQADVVSALDNKLSIVTKMAQQSRAESFLMLGVVAGLIAEIADCREDPHKELIATLRKLRFTASEFSVSDTEDSKFTQNAFDLICEHAETYLRRGD